VTDAELAARIAETAGEVLLALQRSGLFEGKALGAAGDLVANRFIMEALRTQRPDDAILSKEELNDTARCSRSRVWIVDPLDGTREYGEGRSDWAVHIALAVDGLAEIGAVALPGLGSVSRSDAPPAPSPRPERLRMLVSRNWCQWDRRGPRRWRWCAARQRSTSTPAANMSGTIVRPSQSRRLRDCM
jgi:3'(2'), 5'-bisphosphate nucleotidase